MLKAKLIRLDPSVWDATLAANLSGAFYCCYHALPLMSDGGNIINVGTVQFPDDGDLCAHFLLDL